MQKIKANLYDLINAFESCRVEQEYYLDLKTGEILYVSEPAMLSEEIEEIYERMQKETKRYLGIPTYSSREGYRDMEAFVGTVEDENLKEKLWIALDGRGAFRRFKDVLLGYPEKREEWFKFQEQRLKQHVMDWLEENEIKLEEK